MGVAGKTIAVPFTADCMFYKLLPSVCLTSNIYEQQPNNNNKQTNKQKNPAQAK